MQYTPVTQAAAQLYSVSLQLFLPYFTTANYGAIVPTFGFYAINMDDGNQ